MGMSACGYVDPTFHEQVVRERDDARKTNVVLRSALEELVTPNRGMGFGGMDRRFAEENARAVLADPNLGHDYVPRAELAEQQRQYAENISGREQQHQAELRRLEGALAEQARALAVLTEACEVAKADHDARLAKAIEALKKVDEIACRSGPTIGYGEEPPEPLNPDGCELALLARDAIAALQGEQGPGDWAWVRRPDWVSGDAFHACDVERGALQVKLAETQERHRAELRRVAEAVKAACVAAEVARLYGDMDDPARTVDLDAILRGGK